MTTTFSFYAADTGLFTGARVSMAGLELLEANTPAGCVPVEGVFDHLTQRFDLATGSIVAYAPPGPSLASVKATRWETVKAARDAAEFGEFTWDGSVFDSDATSQSRIQGGAQLATLAMLGSQPFSVDWTLADNTVRTMTSADMLAVGEAMGVHLVTVHGIGRALRDAIEAATTAEDVAAIAWPI